MRILLTGGTGYLGSHLVKRMLENGHEMACIVQDKENLNRLKPFRDQVKIIPTEVMALDIRNFCPEVVIHTACVYSRGLNTEKDIFEGNLGFPFEVLQLATECGAKKWINTATILPCMTNSYALSKEQFCQWGKFYAETEKIQFINLRLEQFYGEDAPEDYFLTWVINKLKNDEPLELTAGTQKRDLIHIDDVLRTYEIVVEKDFSENNKEIPVGTGVAPSIREVVEFLKKLIKSNSELCFGAVSMCNDKIESSCNVSTLQELGVLPMIPWKEGLKRVV